MERWAHKVLALFVILVVIFVFTAMPIKVSGLFHRKGQNGIRLLVILNCFGGGVFFGAYLMHMTPEVKDLLTMAWLIPYNINFPMAELFMGAGFFLLMFVEKGISMLMAQKAQKKHKPTVVTKIGVPSDLEVSMGTDGQHSKTGTDANPVPSSSQDANEKRPQIHSIEIGTHHTIHPSMVPQDINSLPPLVPGAKGSALQSLILLAALSLDCIFEGMSLGLQRTSAGVWNLVVAILSHEVVIAFTLGLELFKANSAKKTFIYAVFYAFTAPFGITIGIIIMETGEPSPSIDIVSGIFQAMSAGVFIYCTFLEVLPGQIGHNAQFANIIAVFFGFAFMAAMALIPDSVDEEDGGSNSTHISHLSHIPYLMKVLLSSHSA